MSEILLHYHKVHPVTWVYLSSLLMLGLFFKFSRFWSVRNLDLVLLIFLAPGLLLVQYGRHDQDAALDLVRQYLAQREDIGTAGSAPDGLAAPVDAGHVSPDDSPADDLENPPRSDAVPGGSATAGQPSDTPAADSPSLGDPASDSPPTGDSQGDRSGAVATRAELPAIDLPEIDPDATAGEKLSRYMEALGISDSYTSGRYLERFGFLWLLAVALLFLIRALIDPTMVRRPLLEPNLSTGGLTFIGCSLFVFLMANVISSSPTEDDLKGPKSAEQLLHRQDVEQGSDDLQRHGPGYALLNFVPSIATMPLLASDEVAKREVGYATVSRIMAILSHLAVVIGIVAIGYRHFANVQMGIGAATLYLMLPYTAQMTGRVDHVLPAALLVWAVMCYRRPLTAGIFIGLSIGVVYYPLFLLPLWISFYWQRGLFRFLIGVAVMLAVMALSLVFVSSDLASFMAKFRSMFGLMIPATEGLGGIWGLGWDSVFRLPILTAFVAMSGSLALWPAQKNLGTLLSCSSAVMIATQFWHGYGGGVFLAWFLPLILLTIFRPNLEDRVALTVLGEGWFPRRSRKPTTLAA